MSPVLSTLDLLVLLAVLHLDEEAYGVAIAEAVGEARGRHVAVATVYVALERLEERGLVGSALGEPTAERGGRAKRMFRVTSAGVKTVRATRDALTRLWDGVPELRRHSS